MTIKCGHQRVSSILIALHRQAFEGGSSYLKDNEFFMYKVKISQGIK